MKNLRESERERDGEEDEEEEKLIMTMFYCT
jgi:hypothetical protein